MNKSIAWTNIWHRILNTLLCKQRIWKWGMIRRKGKNILANSAPPPTNIRKRGRNKRFLLFSTKKRGRNNEKKGEEIRYFGQNIYPRIVCLETNQAIYTFRKNRPPNGSLCLILPIPTGYLRNLKILHQIFLPVHEWNASLLHSSKLKVNVLNLIKISGIIEDA